MKTLEFLRLTCKTYTISCLWKTFQRLANHLLIGKRKKSIPRNENPLLDVLLCAQDRRPLVFVPGNVFKNKYLQHLV